MSQATRPNDRHIIWSNQNLDVDDWREDYKEFLEANELDDDPNDEQALYEWMEETNYDYLSDERVNLNVQLSQPVISGIFRIVGKVSAFKSFSVLQPASKSFASTLIFCCKPCSAAVFFVAIEICLLIARGLFLELCG